MTVDAESMRARRYLLGEANEEESAVIEQEYLAREDAVARIAAAEDDLIEDYLADHLEQRDRARFERAYLTVPHRRVRVETIRRLMARKTSAVTPFPQRRSAVVLTGARRQGPWLALAASLLLAASIAVWMVSPYSPYRGRPAPIAGHGAPQPPSTAAPASSDPAAAAARVFAVTLSPIAVRGAAEDQAIVIPATAQVVGIHFEADADARRLTPRRAAIRTVTQHDAWQGPVTGDRIEVPAASLPADDYVVTLYGSDQAGVEHEWNQYFLRIRAR